jgi:hypothetical protein
MSSKIINSVSDFVDTCLQLYPPFREWDKDQEITWSAIMTRELDGYSPAVLDRAFTELVRSRKSTSSKDRSTPTPGECAAFCAEAKRWVAADERQQVLPALREDASDDWSKERQKLAHELVHSAMGRQAAQDDPCWVMALWNFCRKNRRMPTGREIDQCKRSAREFDEDYRSTLRGEVIDADGVVKPMAFAEALQGLGSSMLAKREKLRAEVLGR